MNYVTEMERSFDKQRAQIKKLETALAEANARANDLETLFKATMAGIRDDVESALGVPQMCDAPQAVRRLVDGLKAAEARESRLRGIFDKLKERVSAVRVRRPESSQQYGYNEALDSVQVFLKYAEDEIAQGEA